MNSLTPKNGSSPRRLAVRWLDEPGIEPVVVVLRQGSAGVSPAVFGVPPNTFWRGFSFEGRGAGRAARRSGRSRSSKRGVSRFRAFTLLELMLVVTIIGFLAAMALPHVTGMNRANTMVAATRQLQDDAALARQRAMANRTTVYMVFVPPLFWNNVSYEFPPSQMLSNLMAHQYAAYALVSLRTVGDQPGQYFPHYLTEWRVLPQGVFFSPLEFTAYQLTASQVKPSTIYSTNSLNAANPRITNQVFPLPWNNVIFPSIANGTSVPLPYIAFTPQGTLLGATNQCIVLDRGSIFYALDTNGAPQAAAASVVETPPGNATNNPCLIQIDGVTGRATVVQNQF